MLKGISPLLTGELLKVLAEMGHGDQLAIVDRNFPAASHATRLIELPGCQTLELLAAVLSVFPLDDFQAVPMLAMQTDAGEDGPLGASVAEVVAQHHPEAEVGGVKRLAFYPKAKESYCIVKTGETAPYACYLLTKGVVPRVSDRSEAAVTPRRQAAAAPAATSRRALA